MIKLRFNDPNLLRQALTHRSYQADHPSNPIPDNERLEFLGDSILNYVSAQMLFRRFPEMSEGELTRLRAALVRAESLAVLAKELELGKALRMSKGEVNSGGRERATMLADAFEALIGAMYIDQGLEAVMSFTVPRLERLLEQVQEEALEGDVRTKLNNWGMSQYNQIPVYREVAVTGPVHAPEFTYEVLIGSRVVGRGTGMSKQSAKQAAARDALQKRDARRKRNALRKHIASHRHETLRKRSNPD
jgi:ribonuclease-3